MTVDEMAEKLRQEPYILFKNDCITKSFRLKKQLKALNIPSQVVICIGTSPAKIFGLRLTMPVIHAWSEVEGRRVETSRPLGSTGHFGIIPMHIKALIGIWL